MNAGDAWPKVTVAIPLYRSARFLPIIRENVQQLTYPNLEIIVSDRHGLDDAIDVLEQEFGGDARVAIHRARDGIGWVGHFNYLMHAATGEYLVWMQHDDTFPPGYVETLIAAAARVEGCLIAFGVMAPRAVGSAASEHLVPLGAFCAPGRWTRMSAHRLLLSGWAGVPFRGAIHRQRALAAAGDMRQTVQGCAAEQLWTYALALNGPLVFTPDTHCVKRLHAASATARLQLSPAMFWAGVRLLPAYLGHLTYLRRLEGRCAFTAYTLLRIVYHFAVKPLVPRRAATSLRDVLYRVVNN